MSGSPCVFGGVPCRPSPTTLASVKSVDIKFSEMSELHVSLAFVEDTQACLLSDRTHQSLFIVWVGVAVGLSAPSDTHSYIHTHTRSHRVTLTTLPAVCAILRNNMVTLQDMQAVNKERPQSISMSFSHSLFPLCVSVSSLPSLFPSFSCLPSFNLSSSLPTDDLSLTPSLRPPLPFPTSSHQYD